MFFFVDSFDQSVEVFGNLETLAKHVLSKLGVSVELGTDPIKQAQKSLGKRGRVVTVAAAFGMIAECEDKKAQELAHQFKDALDRSRR